MAAGRMRGAATNADAQTHHPGPLPSAEEGRGSQRASFGVWGRELLWNLELGIWFL